MRRRTRWESRPLATSRGTLLSLGPFRGLVSEWAWRPDLAFPQQLNPGLGWEDWQPRFIDYLYLAFTNATAFSPTDVMPLVPWAKITMAVQSLVSLGILGLVIARAVNVFT